MSINVYLLALSYLIGQTLLSIPETPDNKNRLLWALLVNLVISIPLFISVGKELWRDYPIFRKK